MPDASGNSLTVRDWRGREIDLDAERVALGLGWFSIGLGLIEVLAPRRLGRRFGMGYAAPLLRLYGLREIVAGAGLLASRDKSPWLWARVAGDTLDLATLALGLAGRRQGSALMGIAAVAGVTMLDLRAAREMEARELRSLAGAGRNAGGRGWRLGRTEIERAITIGKPSEELLHVWMRDDVLPRIMAHLAEVRQLGDNRAEWTVRIPGGAALRWRMHIAEADPERGLRFEAEPGGMPLITGGRVSFEKAPAGRGTVMRLHVDFAPPGGAAGRRLAALMGDMLPGALIDKSLHFFKAIAETGEIPTTARQPSGRANAR